MKALFSHRFRLFFFMTLLLAPGCGGGGGGDGTTSSAAPNPFADYVPDPNTYSKKPDPGKILTITLPNGEIRFPSDQIFLLMKAGTTRSDAEIVTTAVGGAIVGQIPVIRFYQVEISGASSKLDLDTAIATAKLDPNVDDAYYNVLSTDYAKCPPLSDLEGLALEDRCPFSENGFYMAIS